jgi:hypothetical protein
MTKNTNNLIVDFYEYEHGNIKCYCYNPTNIGTDYDAEIIVSEDEFEQYLQAEGYLKDASEDCVGADHEGNPIVCKTYLPMAKNILTTQVIY